MKTDEIKKQEELNDEQLDNVAGGGKSGQAGHAGQAGKTGKHHIK